MIDGSNSPSPLLGEEPLTRKARRISLSEIGFGKLESYEKLEQLGEGTYATVFKGKSLKINDFIHQRFFLNLLSDFCLFSNADSRK